MLKRSRQPALKPDLVDKRTPEVVFKDETATVLPPAGEWPADANTGAALLFDYDLDGDLDLLEVAGNRQRLARNDGGKFTDVTAQSGALSKTATASGTAAIAGDYDNDSRPDLFILRQGASTLYHNDDKGSFSDVTAAAKIATPANLSIVRGVCRFRSRRRSRPLDRRRRISAAAKQWRRHV